MIRRHTEGKNLQQRIYMTRLIDPVNTKQLISETIYLASFWLVQKTPDLTTDHLTDIDRTKQNHSQQQQKTQTTMQLNY